MARIPIRAYNREIENLIERGQIEEAISHAKNIIKQFPKYIETYRLLGKAFLESQRYAEAADILQRVLSVFPDDFVSHLGMSIIREDEGNLDAAIWHMERAYENQPFNRAVQDELRRLYGRRDGIEPPRIRLTRGALVRMYAKGDLYPQAIAEIRAALQEDQTRIDLLVLLARMYFLSGQKIEATEICSSLISKLPYCYDANRILMEVLPETSRAEDARIFQQRLFALDPYAAFISPNAPTSDLVPEQTVMVERVDWQPSMDEAQSPDWARTIGVEWEEGPEEELPDWLNSVAPERQAPFNAESGFSTALTEEEPAEPDTESAIPGFLQEAGWTESSGAIDEQASIFEDEETPAVNESEAVEADIPDWLRSLAPEAGGSAEAEPAEQEEDASGWLNGLMAADSLAEEATLPSDTQEEPVSPEGEAPFSTLESAFAESTEAPVEDSVDAFETAAAVGEEEVPDWLVGFAAETTSQAGQETPAEEAQQPETEEMAEPGEETPGWIQQAAAEGWESESEAVLDEEESAAGSAGQQIPEWLQQLSSEADAAPQEGIGEPANEATEPLAFAVDEAEFPESTEPAAEWTPTQETPVAAQKPEDMDVDSAMAWLEALAARQGADEETLTISAPEDRTETAPEWIQKESPAQAGEEGATEELEPVSLSEEEEAQAPEIVGDLLEEAEVETMASLEAPPTEAAQETETVEAADEALLSPDNEVNLDDTDQALAWLEGLAARQGADEETLTISAPEDRSETPPGWVQQESSAPEDEAAMPEQVSFTDEAAETALETVDSTPTTEAVDAEAIDAEAFDAETQAAMDELAEASAVEIPDEAAPEAAVDLTDTDQALAWLEGLAARQGADEETLTISAPEDRSETPPGWVEQALEEAQVSDETPSSQPDAEFTAEEIIAAAEETQEATEVTTASIEDTQPTAITPPVETPDQEIETEPAAANIISEEMADADAAFAWLESLAEKQGAQDGTLLTKPEDRQEAPPEWVAEALEEAETEEAEPPAAEAETAPPIVAAIEEPPQEAILEATDSVEEEPQAPVTAETGEPEPDAEIPEWLRSYEEEQRNQEPVWLPDESLLHETIAEDELPGWLREETAPESPSQEVAAEVQPEAEVKPEAEMPEWLKALQNPPAAHEPKTTEESLDEVPAPPAKPPVYVEPGTGPYAQAQMALHGGDIDQAVEVYGELIHVGARLDDIITDLNGALAQRPDDVALWQLLGDAYMRSNRVQQALDAYTKAEELLR